jgi:hypothetical protein
MLLALSSNRPSFTQNQGKPQYAGQLLVKKWKNFLLWNICCLRCDEERRRRMKFSKTPPILQRWKNTISCAEKAFYFFYLEFADSVSAARKTEKPVSMNRNHRLLADPLQTATDYAIIEKTLDRPDPLSNLKEPR